MLTSCLQNITRLNARSANQSTSCITGCWILLSCGPITIQTSLPAYSSVVLASLCASPSSIQSRLPAFTGSFQPLPPSKSAYSTNSSAPCILIATSRHLRCTSAVHSCTRPDEAPQKVWPGLPISLWLPAGPGRAMPVHRRSYLHEDPTPGIIRHSQNDGDPNEKMQKKCKTVRHWRV